MAVRKYCLKFNIGTGGIHQLPQATGNVIHNLLQEVVWDVCDYVPNTAFQLFLCAGFCQYTSSSVQPHRRKYRA